MLPGGRGSLAYRRHGFQAIERKAWGNPFEILVSSASQDPPPPYELDGDAAIVTIRGPLVHHAHFAWDSYESILERNRAAFADTGAKRVIWLIDSPGGDVDGCFETTYAIRELVETSGKRLEVYTDSMAASAAYALSCAADRIVCSPTGGLGSIGIIEALASQSERDAREGLVYEFIVSGEHKPDGNPHVPITDKARANLQKQVNQIAEVFFSLVEEFRGIPRAKVRALQARMLYGEEAVSAGLADELGMWPTLAHEPQRATAQYGASGTPQAVRHSMKAGYVRHMLKSIAEAEGEDISKEDKEHAKRALKALEEGKPDDEAPVEKQKEESKKGKKAEAEGEGEGEGKKAEAKKGEAKKAEAEGEGEGEGKKAEAKKGEAEGEGEGEDEAEGKKGMAAIAALAHDNQVLMAERAARVEAETRARLMASRNDLSEAVVAWLETQSVKVVESFVSKLPKGAPRPGALARVASASQARATRGNVDEQAAASYVPEDERAFIERKMGATVQGTGVVHKGKSQELGFMTPEEAKEFLRKKAARAASAASAASEE